VIVDLTTLDKCGKFKNFQHLIHVFNGKRGLHLVVLYLVVGYCRVPWGFRVWRGKDTPSPAQLALRLIDTLPKKLTKAFRVIVLADTAFGSVDFLKAVRQRRYPAIVGVRCDRKLQDGRQVCGLCKRGQQVRLDGLSFPVTISWLYLKRDGFPRETICPLHSPPQRQYYHLVGETSPLQLKDSLKPANIDESLHRFGQGTLLGVYRWLVLSLIAFILAHACLLVHQPITTS
jgi:hypothetical protein